MLSDVSATLIVASHAGGTFSLQRSRLASMFAMARDIARASDDRISPSDLAALGSMQRGAKDLATQHAFGEVSANLSELARPGGSPFADRAVASAMEHLRQGLYQAELLPVTRELATAPDLDADTILDRMRSIVSRPDHAITDEDLRFLAAVELLGDHPRRPGAITNSQVRSVAWTGLLPGESDYVQLPIRDLRGSIALLDSQSAARAIERDHTMTRQQLLDELTMLTHRPTDELDQQDIDRVATIQAVTGPKRLPVFDDHPDLDFPFFARWRSWSNDQERVVEQLATVGAWTQAHSTVAVRDALDRVRDGRPLSVNAMYALRRPELLPPQLATELPQALVASAILRSSLDELERSATSGVRDVQRELELVRHALDALPVADPYDDVRRSAIATIDRNVDRQRRRLADGYETYVDFSEIGTAIAGGRLLQRMHAVAAAPVDDARAAATTISW